MSGRWRNSIIDNALATYQDGRIELDSPVDWPDGTRIEVRPVNGAVPSEAVPPRGTSANGIVPSGVRPDFVAALNDEHSFGLNDSFWPLSTEETELLISHMDDAEPLEMTSEELDRMEADRLAQKEIQKDLMRKNWEEIDKLFE